MVLYSPALLPWKPAVGRVKVDMKDPAITELLPISRFFKNSQIFTKASGLVLPHLTIVVGFGLELKRAASSGIESPTAVCIFQDWTGLSEIFFAKFMKV
jgi:hypothetical protein